MRFTRFLLPAAFVALAGLLTSSTARAGVETDCGDGRDNDRDGFTDCDDPDCIGVPPCPGGGTESACADGVDNDGDGFVDCADPDCAATPPCAGGGPERDCTDGEDNDADGLVDCEDSDCAGDPACAGESDCTNGIDDDLDGFVDCSDSDCSDSPACHESVCDDGEDNDGDGAVDCADSDCAGQGCCPGPERCDDLIDNNFDGLIDCEDTDRCLDVDVCQPPGEICDDGEDNDSDERIDCDDPQCVRFPGCPPPPGSIPPPTLAPSTASLGCLWPPNHHYACIDGAGLGFAASGGCPPLTFHLVRCTSNQPDDGLGDGSTSDDCIVDVTGTTACMRSERQGLESSDRVYTIYGVVTDAHGLSSEVEPVGTVRVPHDGRPGSRCEDPLGPR